MSVGPEAGPQLIRAWGPGLEGGVVGKPAIFVVESVGTDVGVLGESPFMPPPPPKTTHSKCTYDVLSLKVNRSHVVQ